MFLFPFRVESKLKLANGALFGRTEGSFCLVEIWRRKFFRIMLILDLRNFFFFKLKST